MATIGRRPRGRGVLCVLTAILLPFLVDASNADAAKKQTFEFSMVPTSGAIKTCLPDATAEVTIKDAKVNQIMKVKAEGLAPNTEYDLFVIQVPHAPFGVAWY